MQRKDRVKLYSAFAMAAAMWVLSLLWAISFITGIELLTPDDWGCCDTEVFAIGLMTFIYGPILFLAGWIWGKWLYRRKVNSLLIVTSSLLLGILAPFLAGVYGTYEELFLSIKR